MADCQLTEKQKNMLRLLVPGLRDGSVKTEWMVVHGDDDITAIIGLDDIVLWREVWGEVRDSDFEDFSECGLFRIREINEYGLPKSVSLHTQRIIDLVDSDLGEMVGEKSINSKVTDPTVVFVVHGRDETNRATLFSFLRAIGLKPLEWSEAVKRTGKSAPYIGEILDTAFNEAQAVVVLMSPDDEVRLRAQFRSDRDEPYEKTLTPQARPNVLFEAGIAMGRSPDRTVLVQIGRVRPFSDIAGRHVIHLDSSTKKRQELAQRLQTAGCLVNLDGTDWQKTGEFKIETSSISGQEGLDENWGKSGNLWWLNSDLFETRVWILQAMKWQIIEGLTHCHHHADQLGMTDRNIVGRLHQLLIDVDKYDDSDLTPSLREQFIRKLDSIRNDIGQIVQSKQPGFRPHPE